VIKRRRRFKQTDSLEERLAAQASDLRSKATEMPAGLQRDSLLKQADLCEEAANMSEMPAVLRH
jgi:hypothetical protein